MMNLIISTVLGILGVGLIIKGADWLTDSVAHLAKALAITHSAIGLILVSALLSLPEVVVAVLSILKGHPSIGFGAILGSVIINLGLIVGASALVRELKISKISQLRDLSFMLAATLIVSLLALIEGELTQVDGMVLILIFVPYVLNVYQQERFIAKKEIIKEFKEAEEGLKLVGKTGLGIKEHPGSIYFFLGGVIMIIGAMLFTDMLVKFSEEFGISEMIIGITLGALGPSLPNLAAAIQATRKGYTELAVTETIGSNIFTILVSVGVIAIIAPIAIEPKVQIITIPALILITLAFIFISRNGKITKKGGAVLLGAYLVSVLAELFF